MRVNIYNILVNNGYKLPMRWTIDSAREDIDDFINEHIEKTDELKIKITFYNDNQWKDLIWRLHDNDHRKAE